MLAHGWWLLGTALFIGRTPKKRKLRLYEYIPGSGKTRVLATFEDEESAARAGALIDNLLEEGGAVVRRPAPENLDKLVGLTDD